MIYFIRYKIYPNPKANLFGILHSTCLGFAGVSLGFMAFGAKMLMDRDDAGMIILIGSLIFGVLSLIISILSYRKAEKIMKTEGAVPPQQSSRGVMVIRYFLAIILILIILAVLHKAM